MPILSILTGKIDFTNLFFALDGKHYNTLGEAINAGTPTLNYGLFLSSIINFFIIALSIFVFIKYVNKINAKIDELKKEEETKSPTTRICPYCKAEINIIASRCPHCTSILRNQEYKKLEEQILKEH